MMKTQNMKTIDLVDALGALKAEMSDLAKREKALKEAIAGRMDKASVDAFDGDLFRVVRVTARRESIDTEAVKRLLADPPMRVSMATSYRVHAQKAV